MHSESIFMQPRKHYLTLCLVELELKMSYLASLGRVLASM